MRTGVLYRGYCRPGVIPAPLLWGCTRSGASWGGDRGAQRAERGCQRRRQDLDVPSETASGVVGWTALRCPRCGLHLEALGQSQVRCRHYPWLRSDQPQQMSRRTTSRSPSTSREPMRHLSRLWVDGHLCATARASFQPIAPEAIRKSPDNLNPKVTSGPFMMAESIPGDHYTLVRNPRYYRASEGLPYLDKVVFRIRQSGHHPQGSAGRHHRFGLLSWM